MDYEDCVCRCLAPLAAQDGPAYDCDWLVIGVNSISSCWASRTLVVGMMTGSLKLPDERRWTPSRVQVSERFQLPLNAV
ncbi:hypothetical protein M405DRAFT_830043 [Rhizopogon salebrosus TDB-379]|nr:hypothetical protein M405DRAFT_830043 [Rhizopogon salebrosus TDB-379]